MPRTDTPAVPVTYPMDELAAVEKKTGHRFTDKVSLTVIRDEVRTEAA